MSADAARERLIALLEIQVELGQHAITTQGIVLASLDASIVRFNLAVDGLAEVVKESLAATRDLAVRIDKVEERIAAIESKVTPTP